MSFDAQACRRRLRRAIEREVTELASDEEPETIPGLQAFAVVTLLDEGDWLCLFGTDNDDVVPTSEQRLKLTGALMQVVEIDSTGTPPWWSNGGRHAE